MIYTWVQVIIIQDVFSNSAQMCVKYIYVFMGQQATPGLTLLTLKPSSDDPIKILTTNY